MGMRHLSACAGVLGFSSTKRTMAALAMATMLNSVPGIIAVIHRD